MLLFSFNRLFFMEKIVLKNTETLQFTYVKDIIYCRGDEERTTFYFSNEPPLTTEKGLNYFIKKLPVSDFFSPDNGILVNIKHVTSLRTVWPCHIELNNGERIHLAYLKRKQIIERIKRLQG